MLPTLEVIPFFLQGGITSRVRCSCSVADTLLSPKLLGRNDQLKPCNCVTKAPGRSPTSTLGDLPLCAQCCAQNLEDGGGRFKSHRAAFLKLFSSGDHFH